MDTNMEDVSIKQDQPAMTVPQDPPNIGTLDGWIESLMACKQLSEADVQRLCEKVGAPEMPILPETANANVWAMEKSGELTRHPTPGS